MPDIDKLMQEWPPEFEELLKEVDLPTADLDCDLSTYVDIILLYVSNNNLVTNSHDKNVILSHTVIISE